MVHLSDSIQTLKILLVFCLVDELVKKKVKINLRSLVYCLNDVLGKKIVETHLRKEQLQLYQLNLQEQYFFLDFTGETVLDSSESETKIDARFLLRIGTN
jgi:hypothetical protein